MKLKKKNNLVKFHLSLLEFFVWELGLCPRVSKFLSTLSHSSSVSCFGSRAELSLSGIKYGKGSSRFRYRGQMKVPSEFVEEDT